MESRIHREVYVRFGREGKQVLQRTSRTLPHDTQLFLGCTDELTASFISDRTGDITIGVSSQAKQLNTWRVSDYTPEYRETSSIGKRKLLTMDEVLRFPLDEALIILRGQKVLKVHKFDYTLHPESKKLTPRKAAEHMPDWRQLPDTEDMDYISTIKPKPTRSRHQAKPRTTVREPIPKMEVYPEEKTASEDIKIIPTDKESIMSS